MRLSKTALLAAASFVTCGALFAVDIPVSSYGGPNQTLVVNTGDTAYTTINLSGSFGAITGEGNFIKNGTGILQYLGYQTTAFYTGPGIFGAEGHIAGGNSRAPSDPSLLSGLTGLVVVNNGELQVGGYLNLWMESNVTGYTTGMQGVAGVVLNDSAVLNFINTPLNVSHGVSSQFPTSSSANFSRDMTLTKRYNVVNNLQVGGIGGGMQTILNTGADNTYRIIIHTDDDNTTPNEIVTTTYHNVDASGNPIPNPPGNPTTTSSTSGIGILAGRGDVIKTGPDTFQILGRSESGIGRIVIADGTLDLADASGNAIATASSVNLVGQDLQGKYGMVGASIAPQYDENPGPSNDVWKNGYVPVPGTAVLKLSSNQTIYNLQADFAFTATPTQVTDRQATINDAMLAARDNQFADEPYVPGTGSGTAINLAGNTLNVIQNRDGVYRGKIVSNDSAGAPMAGGVLNITIAGGHTFALIPDIMETGIAFNVGGAGTFIANANGLGDRIVTIKNLTIYQDNAGTLQADIRSGGTIDLTASAFVNNSLTGDAANKLQINVTDSRGTLAIGRKLSNFTGAFNVHDGETLQLGTGTDDSLNDTLITASSVNLLGDGRRTALYIASGIQTLRNLSADTNSQINIGQASLVIKSGNLAGNVIGVGNLVADTGSSSLALNASLAGYTGATVVKSGTLNVSGGLTQTSGLVVRSGATFNGASADQTVGALFGEAGATVNMGGRVLNIGLAGLRLPVMQTQSRGVATLSTNYLSTLFTGAVPGGNTLIVGTNVDVSIAGNAPTHPLASYIAANNGKDPFDYTDSGLAAATSRYLFNSVYDGPSLEAAATAAETAAAGDPGNTTLAAAAIAARAASDAAYRAAASLGFAGNITGSGALNILGPDRVILSGVNSYTGATNVLAGELQVNWNSIDATSGVAVASGAKFTLHSDTATGNENFTRTITGAGTIGKTGSGLAGITTSLAAFSGNVVVDEGALRIDNLATYSGAVAISSGATLILNAGTDMPGMPVVSNAGTLVKDGAGKIALGGYTDLGTASVVVNGGTLAVTLIPQNVTINAGATMEAAVNGTQTLANPVSGSGTLRLVGGTAPATLVAQSDNLFSGVTLDLIGTTLALNGTTQTVSGFSGDAASSVSLDTNGTFILTTAAGVVTTFNGTLTGAGHLVKDGPGSVSLVSTVNTGWTGDIVINDGRLETTPQALGAGTNPVIVQAAGTLALRNDDAVNAITFLNPVSGAGKIGKTGAGTVEVGSIAVTGGVAVEAGRLITGDAGSDTVFGSVNVSSGATFQVNMTGDRLHDSAATEHVTGSGNLAVSGAHTLTLAGTQSYTGNTELLNGATLVFAPGVTSLNGLAGDATSFVTMPGDLTIVQAANGTFSGNFIGGPGALTVSGTGTFAVTGDLATQAGLTTVTVNGGRLQVGVANTKTIDTTGGGTLVISDTTGTHASHNEYTGIVTGSGNVEIVGGGYVFINDTAGRRLQNSGTTTVVSGTLGGDFATSGNLIVAGGTLAPGNSPGTVTVNGNFTLTPTGTYAVEVNSATSDKVVVTGTAVIDGTLKVSLDSTPGATKPAAGQPFTILTANGGISGARAIATGNPNAVFANGNDNGVVTLDPADQTGTGWKRVQIVNNGASLDILGVASIANLSGIRFHDGLAGLISLMDTELLPYAGGVPDSLLGVFNSQIGSANFARTVANLSPLGYGAEYAMAQDGENRRATAIHQRLEQRRYDRGSPLTADDAPWEAFISGQSGYVDNASKISTPTFDYKTYGGLAGLDRKLNDGTVVGAAIGYDNGEATLHDGGGKIEMNRFAATAFFSGQLTSRWYIDAGVTGGVGLYETKRDTVLGRLKSDNTGYSGGAFAETGTLVVLTKDLHLTPYVGVSYTHHEFDGFKEKGNAAALKVSGWSQDSLRAKIGTGLNYFVPFEEWKLRFGLDVNYAQELLDTDSDIDARFRAGPGGKFRTTANALPDGALGVTPSFGVQITDYISADISYTYEAGLDSRSNQTLNFTVRTRF